MQENPFADLIPKNNQQAASAPMDNPFADLIPKASPAQSMGQQLMSGLTNWNKPVQTSGSNPGQSPLDTVANSSGTNFILGAGDSLANQMRNVANLAPGVNIPQNTPTGSGFAYGAGHVAGDLGGFIAGGVGLDAARAAAEGAPLIGDAAQWLGGSNFLPTMSRLGAGNAAYNAMMSPDHRISGAALGLLFGGLGGATSKAISELSPSNWSTDAMLSSGKLQENLDAAKGTETNLGAVIGSPNLSKFYENMLGPVPFSGVNDQMSRTAQGITNNAKNILKGYLGDTDPLQVNNKLGDALNQAFKDQTALKNNLYSTAEDTAAQSGFSLKPSNFSQALRDNQDAIKNISLDAPTQQLLAKATSSSPSAESAVMGNTGTNIGLKDSNLLASKLNSLSKQYGASPLPQDRNNAGVLGELGSALKNDIRSSISDSGNPDLINQFKNAESNYKNNFSSFLDKDIYQFLQGNGKPGTTPDDLVSNFIKTGSTTDKGAQLSKLMNKLPSDAQNLVKYSYLSRAIQGPEDGRYVDPQALKTLWADNKKLGPNQKIALMPDPAERQAMDNLSSQVQLNTNAFPKMQMSNAFTGGRVMTGLPYAVGTYGWHAGGPVGAALAAGGSILGARGLSKALTSESVRNYLLGKMMQASPTAQTGLKTLGGIGLANSLSQAMLNRN